MAPSVCSAMIFSLGENLKIGTEKGSIHNQLLNVLSQIISLCSYMVVFKKLFLTEDIKQVIF